MKLFSFSRKQDSGPDDPYWEFNPSGHFRPKISREAFEKQTGFDFGWLLLEPLSDMIKKKRHEIDRGRRLSYGQKSLYYWWYIDAEVTNGGFVQFYYNGYDEYVPTIVRGLEYINDSEMVALVQRADALYQKKKRIIERARDEQSFGDNLYDQLEDFEVLDNEYYKLHHQTMARFEAYIRQHPEEFCELE
ncbi:MAG TPA: DUF4375 domain-containing protein [Chitinophagaceae bacterium]|nr:DUF4375 domain-containing protein [Chitinophagaceae bacterium]